jgi:hypothetical protein
MLKFKIGDMIWFLICMFIVISGFIFSPYKFKDLLTPDGKEYVTVENLENINNTLVKIERLLEKIVEQKDN